MDIQAEADAYAEADFSDVNQAFVDRLLELTGPAERAVAVDLGTGPGDIPIRILRALAERGTRDWRVIGVDASEAMLAIARMRSVEAGVADRTEWVLADARSTGLGDAAFDVVFSNSILHHVADPGAFWVEVKRICKLRGLVFLRDLTRPDTEGDAHKIVQRYASAESRLLQEEFLRSLLAAYTVEEVGDQLRQAGLRDLTVRQATDRHLDVYGRLGACSEAIGAQL